MQNLRALTASSTERKGKKERCSVYNESKDLPETRDLRSRDNNNEVSTVGIERSKDCIIVHKCLVKGSHLRYIHSRL